MGINVSGVERFQFRGDQEASERLLGCAGIGRRWGILDRVIINRWLGIALQGSLFDPVLQRRCRAAVPVVIRIVARLIDAEFEPDDVLGVSLVQRLLACRIDDVVRRGDDIADGADGGRVVECALKRNNLCHA
jgi:hypothetical protein